MKNKYLLNQGFITQKVGNEIAIFSAKSSILFTLNETAIIIFQGIKMGWPEDRIVNRLVNLFQIDKKIASKDTKKFINILLKKEIIVKK